MTRIIKTFSYDMDKDADLHAWFGNLGDGESSEAIRAAIRAGLAITSGASLAGVYRVVLDNRRLLESLLRKVESGVIVSHDESDSAAAELTAEQTAALENLKGLGL